MKGKRDHLLASMEIFRLDCSLFMFMNCMRHVVLAKPTSSIGVPANSSKFTLTMRAYGFDPFVTANHWGISDLTVAE